MKTSRVAALFIAFSALFAAAAVAQQDVAGAADPPLVRRMPNFVIFDYERKEFDAHTFEMDERSTTVEGRTYVIGYALREGSASPSALQITRNYTNAVLGIGGQLVHEDPASRIAVLKVVRDGRETWLEVKPEDGAGSYWLTVVERGAMSQEVTANAMLDALNRDGHVALYINFDTGKSTIRTESRGTVDEIVQLMKGNPALAVNVEGHTDTVGERSRNQALSEARAKAVAAELRKAGIEESRVESRGFGPDRPIADNATEEGRAKNRRVELVKRS